MTSKFEQLVSQYLTESGLPPLSNINKPSSSTTSTASTSAVDAAIDNDPAVVNAKKKAADAVALELKKKQNTVTNPV